MSNRIFTRSPYWVSVSGSANDETSVDLYVWNGTGSSPSTPTHSLTKPIPSSLVTQCDYNVSPFIREYISFNTEPEIYNTIGGTTTAQWCNVVIKKYLNGSLVSSTTYVCFDGYTIYEDDYNHDNGASSLDDGTYYYHYDSSLSASDVTQRPGHLTVDAEADWYCVYTDLVNGATYTLSLAVASVRSFYRVYPTYRAHGNKVELFNGSNVLQNTWYFYPVEETKYDVFYCDFINRHGCWQKEYFFKASSTSIETKATSFNGNQSSINYNPEVAQRREFNINGKKSIIVNTGWVDELFNGTLEQLMLSERILLNGKPVLLKTKSIKNQSHIIDKTINYTLEFEYAYDIINQMM